MSYKIPKELRYAKTDEWVRLEGAEAVIGITDFAQDQLGDIVFLELPDVGATFEPGEVFGAIESVKASSDLNAPVGGEVLAVNEALVDNQQPINDDPYGAGWLIRLKVSGKEDPSLLDAAAYEADITERKH